MSWLQSPEAYRDHYEKRLTEVGHLLMLFNPQRMRYFRPPPVGTVILDLGCGPGASTLHYAQLGYKVVAVDVTQSALDQLNNSIPLGVDYLDRIATVRAAAEDYRGAPVDAVLCCDVLEHVIETRPVLVSCYENLLPGGTVYITAPAIRVGQAEHVRGIPAGDLMVDLEEIGFERIATATVWNRPNLPHYPLTVVQAYRGQE